MTERLHLYAAGATHPGLHRTNNDDCFAVVEDLGLLLVADGVGGRPGGDVAAQLAVETVRDALGSGETTWPDDPAEMREYLLDAMARANRCVRELSQRHAHLEGMATTLVAGLATSGRLWVAYVGDSRAYRLRGGRLDRLTVDHRVGDDTRARARLKPEVLAQLDPHLLTRAIGLAETVAADVWSDQLRAGDTLLLCSDGLTAVVDDRGIGGVLDDYHDVGAAVATLIDRVNARGGPDNVTCILARWAP